MEMGILIFQTNGYQFIKCHLIIFLKSAKRMRVSDSLCKYDCSDDHAIFLRFIAVKRLTPRGIIFLRRPMNTTLKWYYNYHLSVFTIVYKN